MVDCFDGSGVLFSTLPGTVAVFSDRVVPFTFIVDGDATLFSILKGIVTSIGMNTQSGFQFMHALREFIYVYVFTERVGELVISGLAFPEICGSQGPQAAQTTGCQIIGSSGLERIIEWYECNRITSRASAIQIQIGDTLLYDAFLVSGKMEIANAETGMGQFSFRFNFIPNITDSDSSCFPLDIACLDSPCAPPDSLMNTTEEL